MRLLPVLILLPAFAGVAACQDRTPRAVIDILQDYADALGDVSEIKRLSATGSLRGKPGMSLQIDRAQGRGVWRSPGLREFVDGDRVFVRADGRFLYHRIRLGVESGQGAAYVMRMLADPFPLVTYTRNPAARRALKAGVAAGLDILEVQPDQRGIAIRFYLHAITHRLLMTSFFRGDKQIGEIRYEAHRKVGGVLLPGATRSLYVFEMEEEKNKKGMRERPGSRFEQYIKWNLNPKPQKAVDMVAPAPGAFVAQAGFARTVLATGPDPHEAAAGDLDGDGHMDIAVACIGGVYVHFARGDGTFHRPVRVALSKWQHRGLVIEDMDRDGRPEILTASRLLPAEMLFRVSFDAARKPVVTRHIGGPFLAHAMTCADLDLDGLGDIVSTGWGSRRLDIKFGNGVGGFRFIGSSWPLANPQNPKPRGLGVAVGYLDKDHLKDIIVADGTRLRAFTGQMNGAFKPGSLPIAAGPRPVDVCFADLNGDGRQDLLVANDKRFSDLDGDIAVLLNTGEALQQAAYYEGGVRTPAVVAGRFNGDAHVDAVAASYLTGEITLLFGDGTGKLGKGIRLASGRGTHRLWTGDVDGDQRPDILASNRVDDTVTIFWNRAGVAAPAPPSRRAVVCKSATVAFELKGLSESYEFVAEFRIPEQIRDPSGIAFLAGDSAHRQFVFVSDKEPSLFRGVIDLKGKRFLVGPKIPLVGAPAGRLDLEGVTFDNMSGNLFLACEARSSVLRVSLFGHVLGEAKVPIALGGNDGIEGIAVRRKKDGTPLLYVFKERWGKTLKTPPVVVTGIEEDPFALPVQLRTTLGYKTPDQTGAAVLGNRMFVVTRFQRRIAELTFDGRGFVQPARRGSFSKLTEVLLGLGTWHGVAEGIAADQDGNLYVLIDNNGEATGRKGFNHGKEGRLLWFRRRTPIPPRVHPRQVVVQHIFIPWQGAKGGPKVRRTVVQAARLAEQVAANLRAGADFDKLAKEYHYDDNAQPTRMTIKLPPQNVVRARGEFLATQLAASIGRLALALEIDEVGVAEFHRKDCPWGFHVLVRIK